MTNMYFSYSYLQPVIFNITYLILQCLVIVSAAVLVSGSNCSTLNEVELPRNYSSAESDILTASSCSNRPWIVGSTCECADQLDGIIYCDSSKDIYVKSQFCMSVLDGQEVVGRCPYTYLKFNDPTSDNIDLFYKVPNQTQLLDYALCDDLNREGFFCSKCKDNYGYPLYPNFIQCVECQPDHYARYWVLYVVVSFVPLTVFLMIVVCLRINAASAPLNAFVFISQIFTQPPFTRGFINTINASFISEGGKVFMRFLHSLYGIWNLDFFVNVIPSFCVPQQNVFSVIALAYVVAIYPLLLLTFLYVLIELHSRDVRILTWLWKPFNSLYVRFRRRWDIRSSIIDAFATFFLLSYVKVLFISFDLLSPSILLTKNASSIHLVSYFDASFIMTPKPTTILVISAIILLLLLFIVFPTLLLLLYPCGFCQRCLTRAKLDFQSLHFLMNSFNTCYKDGTDSKVDCRYFAGVYPIVRLLISIEYAALYFNYYTSVMITCTALVVVVSVVQPYNKRNSHYNRLDTVTIFFLILWVASYRDIRSLAGTQKSLQRFSIALCFLSLMFPLVLIPFHLIINTSFVKKWRKRSSRAQEDLLEQRSHSSHLHKSDYINAKSVLSA